jgi:hypothetical protein
MVVIVTLAYDPLWSPVEWAKKHCPSYITNQLNKSLNASFLQDKGFSQHTNKKYIDYLFGNEKDALIFQLRWA